MTARRLRPGILCAAVSALLWMTWLGWDTQYSTDPVTGDSSGPYDAWQVLGLAVCAAAQVVWFRRHLPSWAICASVSAGITGAAAFSFAQDESGLAAVGLGMMFLGSLAGTALVSLAARLWEHSRAAVAAPSAHVDS